jgi:galactose mutarotase-like enzyme
LTGAEENVVIRVGDCSVTLIPALGGKIASVRVGSDELLQTPLKPYALRTHTMAFSDADASGWDECLPSVADCTLTTEAGTVSIPDHGDLWRVPWQILDVAVDSATLRANCFSLPLQLTRSLILSTTSTGWRLQLLYSLTNLGACTIPWSWSAHPLFSVSEGDRIHLPKSIQSLLLEGSGSDRLGTRGDTVNWPVANTKDGSSADLTIAANPNSGIGDKLFATLDSSRGEDWAALERPSVGLRLTVRFDASLTPYLGLWLCYGGWPDQSVTKQVAVALEPATAPVDALASTGPWSRSLEPGETFSWPMELAIDSIGYNSFTPAGRS